MRFITLILLALPLYGGHCNKLTPVPVPVEPTDTADCGAACQHLRDLGCEEGQPLEDGTTCEVFCVDTQQAGHALAPSCVVTITTCAELETKCSAPRGFLE